MSRLTEPPVYVPTLTEIVHPVPDVPVLTEIVPPALGSAPAIESVLVHAVNTTAIQALMVERVLRQIDAVLERRLHEATEQLIREHVCALLPQLLDEIELVVRESVSQAFEREMPASRAPAEGRPSGLE